MKKRLLILIALIPVVAFSAGFKPDEKLVYKKASDNKTGGTVELKLHVFKPEGLKASDQRPAVVFFFGGGWKWGDPKQFYSQAALFAKRGFVAFSAEYRVNRRNETTPFECVKDGKSAIRWVREHAQEFGVDPNRIVAGGGSAGGHVAACTGLVNGCEEAGDNLDVSSLPNAMLLYNPVLDTTSKGYGASWFTPEQQTDLSPCHQVREGVVPTIVFHGTADKTVPFENAERFVKLMNDAGNTCVLVPFEGKGHGFFNGSFFRKRNGDVDHDLTLKHSIEFLADHGFLEEK